MVFTSSFSIIIVAKALSLSSDIVLLRKVLYKVKKHCSSSVEVIGIVNIIVEKALKTLIYDSKNEYFNSFCIRIAVSLQPHLYFLCHHICKTLPVQFLACFVQKGGIFLLLHLMQVEKMIYSTHSIFEAQ